MLTSGIPPASIYGTWIESLELTSVDDDTYVDLSAATEITLSLIPTIGRLPLLDDLTLKLSTGEITLPSTGIIQWRAEAGAMEVLSGTTYKLLLTIEINGDKLVLILGTVDIVE